MRELVALVGLFKWPQDHWVWSSITNTISICTALNKRTRIKRQSSPQLKHKRLIILYILLKFIPIFTFGSCFGNKRRNSSPVHSVSQCCGLHLMSRQVKKQQQPSERLTQGPFHIWCLLAFAREEMKPMNKVVQKNVTLYYELLRPERRGTPRTHIIRARLIRFLSPRCIVGCIWINRYNAELSGGKETTLLTSRQIRMKYYRGWKSPVEI